MSVPLETERLLLRTLTPSDLDRLIELNSDPEVLRFVNGGRPLTREETAASLQQRSADPAFLAATEKATGEFIGWFDLSGRPGGELSLGYRLRRSAWGRGYATEGSRALIATGFTELGATRIRADAMTVNQRSRRVMEKCGLRFVRTFFLDWPEEIEGSDQGDVEYAITLAQWRALTPAGRTR